MELGHAIGYLGIILGLFVAPPQLIKLIKTKSSKDVSLMTYAFLCLALVCYLLHASYIHSVVFITAQAINLTTNLAILIWLIKERKTDGIT